MGRGPQALLAASIGQAEFDKWGSYLSGALVPISLIGVAMAFRLQQRQSIEQARQQLRAAEIAARS
jgi:hypothetical protein